MELPHEDPSYQEALRRVREAGDKDYLSEDLGGHRYYPFAEGKLPPGALPPGLMNRELAKIFEGGSEAVQQIRRKQDDLELRQGEANIKASRSMNLLIGLAVLGVAFYTFLNVQDILPASLTMQVLLLISCVTGVGIIVYGAVTSSLAMSSLKVELEQKLMQEEEDRVIAERYIRDQFHVTGGMADADDPDA